MKQTFKYIADWENAMILKIEAAQELAIERLIMEVLYPEFIQKRIYDVDKSQYYNRTNVLLEMFVSTPVYHRGNEIFGGIETDSDRFMAKQNADKWQNQSKLDSEPPISATDFVNIINNGVEMIGEGRKHSIFGERPATKFWEDFLKYVEMGEYEKIFYEELAKLTGVEQTTLYRHTNTTRNSRGTIVSRAKLPKVKNLEPDKARRKQQSKQNQKKK